ncbi:MAG: HD domain-containing protein [Fimbriimonadaceae bacterium]|nr:HD domain-containing protein [Fimbriimonadaceae bacterium]QYK55456.1 MAG: HD domain-containing protein [Fimbriimonadaceae bacterium]
MTVEPRLLIEQNDAVRALVKAVEMHDEGGGTHAERVAVYSVAVGERLGLGYDALLDLRRAAALHDLGKLSVERSLLQRRGPLSEPEREEVRQHVLLAMALIESFEWLRGIAPMVLHHHERWDGTGYPDGLAGEAIPIGARIIGCCEAYDVLVAGTPYSEPMDGEAAMQEIRDSAGAHFDPSVVAALETVRLLVQPVRLGPS